MIHSDSGVPYSIMLTVYSGDDPGEFETALESCLGQTHPPSELLVVVDGPLTEKLDALVAEYESSHPGVVRCHRLPENRGRGTAARIGVTECRNDLIGIMSADDISVSDRFERQVQFLETNPDVDIVGGYVAEFTSDPADVDTVRTVPTDPADVERMARFRSPMNEVSVMFRREAVLEAGNYRSLDRMEDYDLWVRLLEDGATLANLPTVLVKMRAGDAMFARRGGLEYAREEVRQQIAFRRMGFIGTPRLFANLAVRMPVRLVPNWIRSRVYRRLFRETPRPE